MAISKQAMQDDLIQGMQEDIYHLRAENEKFRKALKDVSTAYQEMFDVMPVAWQTIDNIVQDALGE